MTIYEWWLLIFLLAFQLIIREYLPGKSKVTSMNDDLAKINEKLDARANTYPITNDSKYAHLYSKLYLLVVQSECSRLTDAEQSNGVATMTLSDKQTLVNLIESKSEYASENLIKRAMSYKSVCAFNEENDQKNDNDEELHCLTRLVETIIVESNELKRDLSLDYNQEEIDTKRLVLETNPVTT